MMEQLTGLQEVELGTYPSEAHREAEFLALLLRVAIQVQTVLNRRFRALGITPQEGAVLVHCSASREQSAGDLAQALGRDKGGITRHLDSLAAKGLIGRHPGRKDRRVVMVRLTPRGRRLVPRCAKVLGGIERRVVRGLFQVELQQMRDALSRVSAALSAFRIEGELSEFSGRGSQKRAGKVRHELL